MTSPPPGSIDLLLLATAVSATVACALLLAVATFVLCYERSKIFTPFNVALLVMALANCSVFLSTALMYSDAYSALVSDVLNLIAQLSSCSFQTAFVHYSWKRSKAVVEMFTPLPQTFIKLLRSPEFGRDTNSVTSAMEPGSNSVTPKFETKENLRKPSRTKLISNAHSGKRFLIIAKYGMASIVCAFFLIIFYLASAYTTSIVGYVILWVLIDVLMNVYFGVLFWMKVELFREKVQSVREKEVRLEENLGKVQLERIRNRQTSQAS
ncbi:hypothetical protein HDU83_003543 [Entophlyctis luteolus]|nr:hypothetical protein HDU83_003543 [Entophlyctis luteolus]